MSKETHQIEKFYDSTDGFLNAFSFLHKQKRPKEKDGDYHMSFSKKHINLESSNPADTIEVATFLKHKSGIEEYVKRIKKERIYVCEFILPSFGEIKDSLDLEALKKFYFPHPIKTCHLLFMIKWNADFSCWERVPMLACSNASSHHEAANWMLQECVKNGSDVPEHNDNYFWNGGILSCFYSEVLSKLSERDDYGRYTRNTKINGVILFSGCFLVIGPGQVFLFDPEYRNIFLGILWLLVGGGMAWIAYKKKPNWKGYPWNW